MINTGVLCYKVSDPEPAVSHRLTPHLATDWTQVQMVMMRLRQQSEVCALCHREGRSETAGLPTNTSNTDEPTLSKLPQYPLSTVAPNKHLLTFS